MRRLTRITTIRLSGEDAEYIEQLAERLGSNPSRLMRGWIKRGIAQERMVEASPLMPATSTAGAQPLQATVWYAS